MKYYSKSPSEFRKSLQESTNEERVKRKKTYLLQIANFGVLAVAVIIMLKAPEMFRKNKAEEESVDQKIIKTMAWKGWSLESTCKPADHCSIFLTRRGKDISPDAFFWKITGKNSVEPLLKTFELIPKEMKVNETRSFHLTLDKSYESGIVSIHFIDSKNEELLSMQIYP